MEDKIPPKLKPFLFHGINFLGVTGSSHFSDCPFCAKPKSFHVNQDTGQWVCSSSPDRCGKQGNIVTFLEQLVAHANTNTTVYQWNELSEWRGGIPSIIFKREGLGYSDLNDSWLVPVRTDRGTIQDVRALRWKSKKRKTMGTAGMHAGLGGLELLVKADPKLPVYICEGEWDAFAMRWLLRKAKMEAVVTWVPGARIFKDEWVPFFKGRHVIFMYDNDADGDVYSWKAACKLKKTVKMLEYINWPETLPSGFDVRDFITQFLGTEEMPARQVFGKLHKMVLPTHRRRGTETLVAQSHLPEKRERPKSNPSFQQTIEVYRKHLRMCPDLEQALLVLFSCVFSNQLDGDPLWLFLVGPPGSGKTELLQSMMTAPNVFFQSSVSSRQLVSGWKTQNPDDDPSLIPRMIGNVTVFKDWTEMLSSPEQLHETGAILRGAYDGHVHKEFGHGVIRDYYGYFSILAGVTNAIHGHSTATMGERFLKYQLESMNTESMFATLSAALRGVGKEKAKNEALQHAANAFLDRDVPGLDVDEMIDTKMERRLNALANLVGVLRHVVERERDGEIKFKQAAEVGTRLVKQLAKLGMCVAFALGKKKIDEEVQRVIERVAFDTAIGFSVDIVQSAFELGGKLLYPQDIHLQTGIPSSTLSRKIEDLCLLKVLVRDKRLVPMNGGSPKQTYKLSFKMRLLWKAAGIAETYLRSALAGRK